MGQKVIIGFGWNLDYRLDPEIISPLFADLSSALRIFEIVFRDSSLYRKQLSLFYLQ